MLSNARYLLLRQCSGEGCGGKVSPEETLPNKQPGCEEITSSNRYFPLSHVSIDHVSLCLLWFLTCFLLSSFLQSLTRAFSPCLTCRSDVKMPSMQQTSERLLEAFISKHLPSAALVGVLKLPMLILELHHHIFIGNLDIWSCNCLNPIVVSLKIILGQGYWTEQGWTPCSHCHYLNWTELQSPVIEHLHNRFTSLMKIFFISVLLMFLFWIFLLIKNVFILF